MQAGLKGKQIGAFCSPVCEGGSGRVREQRKTGGERLRERKQNSPKQKKSQVCEQAALLVGLPILILVLIFHSKLQLKSLGDLQSLDVFSAWMRFNLEMLFHRTA